MCHNNHLRRAKARAHGFLLHHSARLHNLSYLSGEHNCTRFPTSGQGYFLRRRHGVHHLLLLITAPEPSQPLCLEQQNHNNLLSSTFHQVARSEIAPQSNGSCPIICPRLWSASKQMRLLDAKWILPGTASLLPQLRAN